ncbi:MULTISPECIES: SagB/ThcOx family dehydrogenase [Prauserella salsuginis group]|uniref:SagB/ThcOx family dehydrogenase n=1 Tax=Prauserella salsuginis TaxID=387889 RepID=A0ABW6G918_9PSEU|nr:MULTISPECIES: SagB/ThcOx family dehydrogenase [Prauserella salsuginis group]MCR3719375.1 SagB-type dehydrogenase domain-containing protein [Prauserella flava]MCR3735611.1 SagB-type dehydrogenase domain-containing protein [Prauserella salsuginis]
MGEPLSHDWGSEYDRHHAAGYDEWLPGVGAEPQQQYPSQEPHPPQQPYPAQHAADPGHSTARPTSTSGRHALPDPDDPPYPADSAPDSTATPPEPEPAPPQPADDGATDPAVRDTVQRALAVHRLLNGQTPPSPDTLPALRRIPLPDVEPPRTDLVKTLVKRRSWDVFAHRGLDLAALSGLLRFALGVQRFEPAYGSEHHPMGMAPSGDGLDLLRAYVLIRGTDILEPGVYRYEAIAHELTRLTTADPVRPLQQVYWQPEFAAAPVTIALTTQMDVAFQRKPLRHYRTMHVDSGIAVQNVYLIATALGLACCAVSDFDDANLSQLLGVPESEIPTMLVPVGHPPE